MGEENMPVAFVRDILPMFRATDIETHARKN